ncbi:MAG: hypothetical protein ACE5GW_08180 [Planctomycetota bacterium]
MGRRRAPRAALLLLASLLLLAASGCGGGPNGPRLISARFLDDLSPDGSPQVGEGILLTFSAPISLDSPVRRGVTFLPEGHRAGAYELTSGPADHQLLLKLGSGTLKLVAAGHFGDRETPDSSGVLLDYGRIGLLSAEGRRLEGIEGPVDLAQTPPQPARIVEVEWLDMDRGYTVSEGDILRLVFDRPVHLSPRVKSRMSRVPPRMFILPVGGDRLDDGKHPSTLLEAVDVEEVILLTLGSRPRLTVQGEFDPRAVREVGSPSGVAINGTSIRPHGGILEAFGVGAASSGVTDIRGDARPFAPEDGFPRAGELRGHTATRLPDGGVVIIGGRRVRPGGGSVECSNEAWIYEASGGPWLGPFPMKFPRAGHTASWFPGRDGIPGNEDDYVLVVGGWDGEKALTSLEVFLPYLENRPFYPIDSKSPPTPRFEHTAHAIAGTNLLVVVGGRHGEKLNGTVEIIEAEVIPIPGDYRPVAGSRQVGVLEYPRTNHASALLESEAGLLLFIYGGYGNSVGAPNVPYTREKCDVLSAPELLRVGRDHTEAQNLRLGGRGMGADPGRRLGPRLVPLLEERWNLLLVGGTRLEPGEWVPPERRQECLQAYRIEIEASLSPARIHYRPVGKLEAERHNIEATTLPSGRVLIVGGMEEGRPSARAELFDPSTGDIEPLCRDLQLPREGFTLEAATEDVWLILGGTDSEEIPAEIFRWRE